MAAGYLQQAHAILNDSYPHHPKTYVCLGDWSFYLPQSQDKWRLLEQAALEAVNVLGPQDPATIYVKYQLGKLLCRLDNPKQLSRCIVILQENLESRLDQHGHDPFIIAEAMLSLGKAKVKCRDDNVRKQGLF